MKVKLLKRVWGYEPGRELDLKGDQLDLVLRKKYAELVPLKKLDPEVKPRKTKVDPALKTRKNK